MKLRSLLAGCLLVVTTAMCTEYEPEAALPCNEDPWSCPAGQTCWILSDGTASCINASSQKAGGDCNPVIGTTDCDVGLACIQPQGTNNGRCTEFCSTTDVNHKCPMGFTCHYTELPPVNSKTVGFYVCLP